jgi:predicted nucleic acid-binding protein
VAVILDTNAVSALLAGEPALGDVLAAQERHQLPVVVIGEYRCGLLRPRHREPLERLLGELADECEVLEVGRVTPSTTSRSATSCARRGRPIPENDVWIAALAREHAQPVVSRDEHFDHVVGIRRVGW